MKNKKEFVSRFLSKKNSKGRINFFKKRAGFTLIELLVVVAIMGLLAALAVISLNSARARARDASRISNIKQVQTALELYFLDNYKYPADPTHNLIEGLCLSSGGDFATACSGTTYMGKIPENPQPRTDGTCDDTEYTYNATNVGTNGTDLSYYIIYCLGHATGDISAGIHHATPAGIADP